MKFLVLHDMEGAVVYLVRDKVCSMEQLFDENGRAEIGSRVTSSCGDAWNVKETLREIRDLIKL